MAAKFIGRSQDIVLFVIGGNGAGKSTFINYILEEVGHPSSGSHGARMKVHDELSPCTLSFQPVRLEPTRGQYQGTLGRIVLVDGPGLEDVNSEQHNKVLTDAKEWLHRNYPSSINPRRGIIYIQDISMCPLDTSTIKLNLMAPSKLAKRIDCEHILLATMKWGKLSPIEVGQAEAITAAWPKRYMASAPSVHKIEEGNEGPCALAAMSHFLAAFEALAPGSGQKDDVAILVLGPLKCGKSTFVNAILKKFDQPAHMQVTDSMTATTHSVESAIVQTHTLKSIGERRIVLIDSPGFTGDDIDDAATLRLLSAWFCTRYNALRAVTCLAVYLHDISHDGFARTAGRVIELLPQLIRKIALKKIVIATTKWDRSFEDEGLAREGELQTKFWSGISTANCTSRRLSGRDPYGSLLKELLEHV